jgi:hypothetical protein
MERLSEGCCSYSVARATCYFSSSACTRVLMAWSTNQWPVCIIIFLQYCSSELLNGYCEASLSTICKPIVNLRPCYSIKYSIHCISSSVKMPHMSYILQQQELMHSIDMENGYVRKGEDSGMNFRMLQFHTENLFIQA